MSPFGCATTLSYLVVFTMLATKTLAVSLLCIGTSLADSHMAAAYGGPWASCDVR